MGGYTLIIDNYDSFTWNVYADVANLGGNPLVKRNDKITIEEVEAMWDNGELERLIISPGPGHPSTDSGISRDIITWGLGKLPVLGICMGLECLVDVLGGDIAYAGEIKHGKTSLVEHDNLGIFHSLPPLLSSTRYHSLAASVKSLPKSLQVSATTQESGVIMAVRHRQVCCEAVQYHPESCMSEGGKGMMANFLKMKGGTWAENPWCGVTGEEASVNGVGEEEQGTGGEKSIPNGAGKGEPKIGGPSLPTILNRIQAQRLLDVESVSSVPATTQSNITKSLDLHACPPLINFVDRIKSTPHTAVMAEVKRASPSKGDIAPEASAPAQGLKYALAGASVISVLTEPSWFKGSLVDMLAVRNAVDSLPNRPAILRKDFILSTYQIDEARLYGADTVLLIVAMLDSKLLKELYAYSVSRGMEPLVEVNNPSELTVALDLGAKVIGVNNRNLHDFAVDMSTTSRVNAALQGREDTILCALSGISQPSDVEGYVKEGVKAILVGEALMRASDTKAFLRSLVGLPPAKRREKRKPLVKICGVRSAEDAQVAIDAGADLIGIILVQGVKRTVSVEVAQGISNVVRSARQRLAQSAPESASTPASASQSNGSQNSGSKSGSTSSDLDLTSTTQPWFFTQSQLLSSRRKPLLVGVFRNQPLSTILDLVDTIGLDIIQLHGNEPQSWAKFIPVPVIKTFSVSPDGGISGGEVNRPGLNGFVLLDAAAAAASSSSSSSVSDGGGGGGGEGKSFPWEHAKRIINQGEIGTESSEDGQGAASGSDYPLPVILAGGLTPENVKTALDQLDGEVLAVDVSSGVEAEGGMKDAEKVREFVRAVKGAQ